MKSSSPVDMVVLGAGCAGAVATNRLIASLNDIERGRVQVSVVNPRAEFAPGSIAAAGVPGVREHAFLLADPDGARRAAAAIGSGPRRRVLVVGGGLTGVEVASEIAERHPDAAVTLVSAGPVLAGMRAAARRSIAPDSVARHLRMSCAAALPLGGHAAGTVLATLRGEQPSPLSIGFAVQCISLGRRSGYIQVVRPDDSSRAWHLGGRLGAVVKERVCAMVLEAPRKERTRPGSSRAPHAPKAAA